MEKKNNDDDFSRVKVHIRLKSPEEDKKGITYNIFARSTQLQIPNSKGRLELDKWYRFDHIYSPIACNKEVYKISGYDLVENSLKGINTAIFAYGQEGSGKTITLMSKDGLMAHLVSHLFHRIWKRVNQDVKVGFSYFQIHNERIYDLLNFANSSECVIKEDAARGTYVENVTSVICETPVDVYDQIKVGRKALHKSETKMNRLTSRSHTIFQLSIEKKKKNPMRNRRSMQDSCSALSEFNEVEIDFNPTPFRMQKFRRSLNTVSSSDPNERSPPNKPVYQRARTDVIGHAKTNSISSPGYQRSTTCSPGSLRSGTDSVKETRHSTRSVSISLSRKGLGKHLSNRSNSYEHMLTSNLGNVKVRGNEHLLNIEDAEKKQNGIFIPFNPRVFDEEMENNNVDCDDKFNHDASDEEEQVVHSKISIINLAGSERLYNADRAVAERLKENQNVNLSLLELGNVISALAGGKKTHTNYRNSLLTRLAHDALGGNCKTNFILFASTKVIDVSETKYTLEFGQKLMKVSTKPKLNFDIDYKRRYEMVLSQLAVKKEEEEEIKQQQIHQLIEFERDKEEVGTKIRELELVIVELQTKLHSVNVENKNNAEKMYDLQNVLMVQNKALKEKENSLVEKDNILVDKGNILTEKDNMLNTQEMVILKHKVEVDILLGKLAALEKDRSDASTSTTAVTAKRDKSGLNKLLCMPLKSGKVSRRSKVSKD